MRGPPLCPRCRCPLLTLKVYHRTGRGSNLENTVAISTSDWDETTQHYAKTTRGSQPGLVGRVQNVYDAHCYLAIEEGLDILDTVVYVPDEIWMEWLL